MCQGSQPPSLALGRLKGRQGAWESFRKKADFIRLCLAAGGTGKL